MLCQIAGDFLSKNDIKIYFCDFLAAANGVGFVSPLTGLANDALFIVREINFKIWEDLH